MQSWYQLGFYLTLALASSHVLRMIGGTISSNKVSNRTIEVGGLIAALASLVTLGWTIWGATIRWSATGAACSSQYPTGATSFMGKFLGIVFTLAGLSACYVFALVYFTRGVFR